MMSDMLLKSQTWCAGLASEMGKPPLLVQGNRIIVMKQVEPSLIPCDTALVIASCLSRAWDVEWRVGST